MYCKLCGEHLYREITWSTLFKWHYVMHLDCEDKCKRNAEYVTFPLLDKLVHYDFLFFEGGEQSDTDYLFVKYMGQGLQRALKKENWSILVLIDDLDDMADLGLIVPLADREVILLSLFDTEILASE